MKPLTLSLTAWAFFSSLVFAVEPATPAPAKPVLKIIPGQVIVPFDRMRRPWGELVSLDLKTRTGKFRHESTDEIMSFTVLPYAELLHHATNGDLQDFRVGERAIFRLHENEAGEWTWLTYIQDEMNMMNGHKEYFHVEAIDAEKGRLTCTWANADRSFLREKGVVIETDAVTRFWKAGSPAKLADIKLGERLRTKTHGVGKGKARVAWEVFLDEASLEKFQEEQRTVHAARMQAEGAPGYVDEVEGEALRLTIFNEGREYLKTLRPGQAMRVAPAGVDRQPTASARPAKIVAVKAVGRQTEVSLAADGAGAGFQPRGLARLWLGE